MTNDSSPTRYAGFWLRLVADVIDTIVLNLVAWPIELALSGAMYGVYLLLAHRNGVAVKPFADAFDPMMTQILDAVVLLTLGCAYYVWGQFRYGTTLGKRIFRIYVVRMVDLGPMTLRQSWVRFFGYFVSYATLGCGYLMAAFHPQKRALHDLIAGTVSVIKSK